MPADSAHSDRPLDITDALLKDWPLPMPAADGDKEERGRVLIVGGSTEIPGAVLLAGMAALRAGAGKLTIATVASAAAQLGIAIPEARVVALQETAEGGIAPHAAQIIHALAERSDAVLIGPGMQDEPAACGLTESLLQNLPADAKLVLDACAMNIIRQCMGDDAAQNRARAGLFLGRFPLQVLLTPHAGEMARLTGMKKESVLAEAQALALEAARNWGAAVALKGATTILATPDGGLWRHQGGNSGLAVSGSGDTLAGIIAGLAARGAPLEQACVWGIALHARAGVRLAEQFGPLGYLAREIPAQVPTLMQALAPHAE